MTPTRTSPPCPPASVPAPATSLVVPLHYARLVVRSTALPSVASFHAFLHRAFPQEKARVFLFRADRGLHESGRFNVVRMLVQAPVAPDLTRLDGLLESATREALWTLAAGARFRFYLRANTVRDRALPAEIEAAKAKGVPWRTHEIAARTTEDRMAWLAERAATRGFEAVGEPWVLQTVNRAASSSQGGRARLYGCDYQGVLRVTDPQAFAAALRHGIGGQRAYGYGMLSLASV